MFVPNAFKMANDTQAQQFIQEFSFGVLISNQENLTATHLPFILNKKEGKKGVLYAHCARANSHWKELQNAQVLVIFSGPHGYISPSWYTNKPAVPTWNYAAVHTYGKVSLLDQGATLNAIDNLVAKYEPALVIKSDIVTEQIKHKLLAGIVGFKIEITRLEGQVKLGQNRSLDDQNSVFKALIQSSDNGDIGLAKYMQKIGLGSIY